MDAGAEQRQMSETIKARIKQNTAFRREQRSADDRPGQGIIAARPMTSTLVLRAISHDSELSSNYVFSTDSTTPMPSIGSFSLATHPPPVNQADEAGSSFKTLSSLSDPIVPPTTLAPGPLWSTSSAVPIHMDLSSVMIYLDHVFPFLFPFYQPSLVETGRQWVLGLLCQNGVSFHIAASLSAYFFSLIPQNEEQDIHEDCKYLIRSRLLEQMKMAIESIQTTISAVSHHGAQCPLLDKARVMQEVTQLLIVEITVQRDANWNIHLTPALILFNEIFEVRGTDRSEPSLATVLSALPSLSPVAAPYHKPLPYTADQLALMFFVSLILFIDIVASTSLGMPPALQSFHNSLLSISVTKKCYVQFEAIVGCQNWALVAIGNISALSAWKRDTKRSGSFSVVSLVNHAMPISQALEEGLTNLNIAMASTQPRKTSTRWLDGYYSQHGRTINHTAIANITRIWVHTAKIYLFVTLSGWQPNSTDIQANVARVLGLLQAIEPPAQLRSLSWPIAVAGCLALSSQEDDFRRIFGSMGRLSEFGTVLEALHVMEAVWESREVIDGDVWDLASCLSILGSPVLLV